MFDLKEKSEFLIKQVFIGIRAKAGISKIDVVKNRGLGIWFRTTEGDPDLIIYCESEEEAIEEYKQFHRALMKTKIKLIRDNTTCPIEKEKP